MSKIKYPQLCLIEPHDKMVDTTTVVDFYEDHISLVMNGERHHIQAQALVTFGDDRYERIYDSLKDRLKWLATCQNHMSPEDVFPAKHKVTEMDFTKMTWEDMRNFIESGRTYTPDKRKYFDDNLFDVMYCVHPLVMYYRPDYTLPSGDHELKSDTYECRHYKQYSAVISEYGEHEDYAKIILNNKELIEETLKRSGYNCIYKIRVHNYYFSEELVIPIISVCGTKINK